MTRSGCIFVLLSGYFLVNYSFLCDNSKSKENIIFFICNFVFSTGNKLNIKKTKSSIFCHLFGFSMIKLNLPVLFAQRGLRVADAERDSGVNRATLYRLYNNESSRIDFETLDKLCIYLDCEPKDVFIFEKPNTDAL